jgi:hypothetical protein
MGAMSGVVERLANRLIIRIVTKLEGGYDTK